MRGETRKVKLEVGKKAGRRWRHKVSAKTLQNGKMRNEEEKSRSLPPPRARDDAGGERRKSGPPQKAAPTEAESEDAGLKPGATRQKERACGKAEDSRHHHQCGAEQGSTQGLVEKERASNDNCPNGQAKTGRSTAKRGERK